MVDRRENRTERSGIGGRIDGQQLDALSVVLRRLTLPAMNVEQVSGQLADERTAERPFAREVRESGIVPKTRHDVADDVALVPKSIALKREPRDGENHGDAVIA